MRQVRFGWITVAACVGATGFSGCGKSGRIDVGQPAPSPQPQAAPAASAPQTTPTPTAAPVPPPPSRAAARPGEKPLPPGRISLTDGLRKAMETAETTPVPAWVPLYPESARPTRVSPVGGKLTFEQSSDDAPEDVLLHYQKSLTEAGFQVEIDSKSEDPRAPGVVKATKASPRQAFQISVTPAGGANAGSRLLFSVDAAAAAK